MKGKRSIYAGALWEKMGNKNVHHYNGGWYEWNEDWTREQWVAWSKQTGFPLA
jgi:hypothetical protein